MWLLVFSPWDQAFTNTVSYKLNGILLTIPSWSPTHFSWMYVWVRAGMVTYIEWQLGNLYEGEKAYSVQVLAFHWYAFTLYYLTPCWWKEMFRNSSPKVGNDSDYKITELFHYSTGNSATFSKGRFLWGHISNFHRSVCGFNVYIVWI